MNNKIFLNVFPVSSGTRWVGELDLSTVQYRYHSAVKEDRFLNTAEEAVDAGYIHAAHFGVPLDSIVVQVFASHEEYSGLDVFTLN